MNSRDIQNLSEAYLGIYSEDFKELNPYKTELVQGRHAQLASEILKNRDEVKRLSKKPFARHRPGIKQKMRDLVSQSKRKHKLAQNASDALIRSSVGRSAKIQKKIEDLKTQLPGNKIVPFQREELEYLISYLIDEGYATNLESAEVILNSMSEGWKTDVLKSALKTTGKIAKYGAKKFNQSELGKRTKNFVKRTALGALGVPLVS